MNEQDTKRTRVFIADARPDVREALTALLDATDEFEVVGEACSPDEAATCAPQLAPDIIVLDPNGAYDSDVLGFLAGRTPSLVLLTLQDGLRCRATARDLGAIVIGKGTGPDDVLAALRRAGRQGSGASCPIRPAPTADGPSSNGAGRG